MRDLLTCLTRCVWWRRPWSLLSARWLADHTSVKVWSWQHESWPRTSCLAIKVKSCSTLMTVDTHSSVGFLYFVFRVRHTWDMWKKVIAVLIGIVIGYWFIDDFDPGESFNRSCINRQSFFVLSLYAVYIDTFLTCFHCLPSFNHPYAELFLFVRSQNVTACTFPLFIHHPFAGANLH